MVFEDNYNTWHKWWSYGKSLIRVVGCVGVMIGSLDLFWLATFLLVAEGIGVIEEWV